MVGISDKISLPDYLDWLPIEVKVFWFFERGLGEPLAKWVLFKSQGEQMLFPIQTPLRQLKLKQLQENENGLEAKVNRYIDENGFSRTPRNQ